MTTLNITRMPGESEPDFQRRYTREKMRIYRARKPKGPKKLRGSDAKPRKNSPYTPEEWAAMQRQPGESELDWKRRNSAARMRIARTKNPERTKAQAKAFRDANPEKESARHADYRARNPDKVKASQHRYYLANKEKRMEALKAWASANPERYAEVRKRWYDDNRALRNSYSARWRRQSRIATPPWADHAAILAIYAEAIRISEETGIQHHVDHFYPLKGRTVSGLHVETNLRIIPAVENIRKNNRHPEWEDELAFL